ncbi:MAG: stage II sporulation protein R [Firmicutes bacterium]|nr:stage II sporulation protein R [Bacillota bacterium]
MKIIRRELKFLGAALAAGLFFTAALGLSARAYSEQAQKDIAENVIRFHVLANSDSAEDQALKIKIRDAILDKFGPGLQESASVGETRDYIRGSLGEISALANGVARENGFGYPVTARLSVDFFPTKSYGDLTLPAGDYEALRVEIGGARGHNWWCIMFPPLCYVDVTKNNGAQIPDAGRAELKKALTPGEYELLTSSGGDVPVKIKFKIVEWWQNLLHRNDKPTEIASSK